MSWDQFIWATFLSLRGELRFVSCLSGVHQSIAKKSRWPVFLPRVQRISHLLNRIGIAGFEVKSSPDCATRRWRWNPLLYTVYEIQASPDFRYSQMYLKLEQTGLNWIFKNLRVPKELNGILPLGLRKHFGNHLFQKLTHTQLMSACHIENNRIQTFDHKIYHYELNDCNHLLFKDCSRKLPVAVLARSVPGAKSSKIIEILSGVSHLIVKAKNPKVPGGDLIIESKVNSRRKKSIELKNLTSTHFEFCSESKDVLFDIRRYTDNVYSIWFHKESLQV